MLNKQNRLKKKKEIENVFKGGRSFYSKDLGIRFKKNNLEDSRFCLVVSAKVSKKAVIRNKIKRRARYILRGDLEKIKKGFDIVVVINKQALLNDFDLFSSNIRESFKACHLYV